MYTFIFTLHIYILYLSFLCVSLTHQSLYPITIFYSHNAIHVMVWYVYYIFPVTHELKKKKKKKKITTWTWCTTNFIFNSVLYCHGQLLLLFCAAV